MACKMLETTNLPVTEIALRTGFGSNSYFTKMFHRTWGITPVAHRKAYRALQEEREMP
jgi:transcriptional regulator GlxA family with amidase domain